MMPVQMLLERHGDPTFAALLRTLCCSKCGGKPAPLFLVSGHHRTVHGGPEPDWAVELVPMPSSPARQALRAISEGLDRA